VGRKRGHRAETPNHRWTTKEWDLIGRALDEGLGAAAVRDLGWLPHMNTQQIRNGLNILRRKRNSLCGLCNAPVPKGENSCTPCKQKQAENRAAKVANGLCAGCSHPLDVPGSSATMCPRCLERHRESLRTHFQRKSPVPGPKRDKTKRYTAFPWPAARSFTSLIPFLPEGYDLVDLFGGAGGFSVAAHQAGRTLLAFNDIHPGVTTFVEAAVAEGAALADTVKTEWKKPHPSAPSEFLMGVHRTGGSLTKPTRLLGPPPSLRRPLERLQGALQGSQVTNLDFTEAVRRFDGPKTLFVADPPWQGCEDAFEYRLGERHEELAEVLLGLEGQFLLMTASNREALRTWARAPYLYWKLIGTFAKELVASSFPIPHPKLQPVDPERFGLAA